MKTIKTKFMRLIGKKYFLFFGLLFTTPKAKITEVDTNHEKIHSRQIYEVMLLALPAAILLWIFSNFWLSFLFVLSSFYLWYVIEWIIRLFQYRDAHLAYRNISFEREAYENDKNLEYLQNRKLVSFIRYL